MRIAVIGAGISGLCAAYLLHPEHDITVYEQNDYAGGHTNTIRFELDGRAWAIDTGFIAYNDWTYPSFIRLLRRLGVESQPTRMSFGVRDERSGVEYRASGFESFFAQKKNLVRVEHWGMLRDIRRLGRDAGRILRETPVTTTLGELVVRERYGRAFVERFLLPMAGAIWSADAGAAERLPVQFFLRFFVNHGMLSFFDQPTWRTIRGGSDVYVAALTRSFRERILLRTRVRRIARDRSGVDLELADGDYGRFDRVIIACHSDQALALLSDASAAEREVLSAIEYQPNRAVLHTDERLLPEAPRARAAWNYVRTVEDGPVAVTYDMNRLQRLTAPVVFCVTLNREDLIDAARVIRRIDYHHPIFTPQALAAQRRIDEISGPRQTHYCGAYWSYGFHEDGVRSALRVARAFGRFLR